MRYRYFNLLGRRSEAKLGAFDVDRFMLSGARTHTPRLSGTEASVKRSSLHAQKWGT
jgi:hypothetical protein